MGNEMKKLLVVPSALCVGLWLLLAQAVPCAWAENVTYLAYENGGFVERTASCEIVTSGTTVTLKDANPPADKAFYVIGVSVP